MSAVESPLCVCVLVSLLPGVVTFCHRSATPVCAEEGLTGVLTGANDTVGHATHCQAHFTSKEDVCLSL